MTIEIYDERELDAVTLTTEPDTEALDLIHELGLKRQLNENGSRVAYPSLTEDQILIIRTLFSQATRLEDYDAGAIPLRVLKEIRSYKAENPSHRLVICHAPPAQIKDPILLSCSSPYSYVDTSMDTFDGKRLIARWGDGLEAWDVLLARAQAIMRTKAEKAIGQMISKLTMLRQQVVAGDVDLRTIPTLSEVP